MPEEQNAQQPDASQVADPAPIAGDTLPKTIPYDRFQEVNNAKKAAEDKLQKLLDAEKERLDAEAVKKGDYQAVIDSLKPKADRTDALEATLKSYLDAEIESIPEQYRDLVPDGDVTAQLTWIKKAKAKGTFSRIPHPNSDAGASGDPKTTVIKLSDTERALARQVGMTDEQYYKAKHPGS